MIPIGSIYDFAKQADFPHDHELCLRVLYCDVTLPTQRSRVGILYGCWDEGQVYYPVQGIVGMTHYSHYVVLKHAGTTHILCVINPLHEMCSTRAVLVMKV